MRAARNDLILNLDDDMVPAPGFVAAHAAAHAERPERLVTVGYAAPVLGGRRGAWACYQRAAWEDHYRRKAEPDHPWTYFDFSVGNSSLRRELLDAIGGFDETMRRHDDQECGMRLVGAGARFRLRGRGPGVAPDPRRSWGPASRDPGPGQPRRELGGPPSAAARTAGRRRDVQPRGPPLSPRSALFFNGRRLARVALRLGPWPLGRSPPAHAGARPAPLPGPLRRRLRARAARLLRRPPRLEDFVAPVRSEAPAAHLTVDLGGPPRSTFRREGGRVTLELVDGRAHLGTLEAREAAREWNWEELTERALDVMVARSRQAPSLERLLELSRAASRADGDHQLVVRVVEVELLRLQLLGAEPVQERDRGEHVAMASTVTSAASNRSSNSRRADSEVKRQ